MLNIVLIGPPGAGKGTQAKNIVERYGLIHISTGDIIRKEISEETELGLLAKSVINEGRLLSDELMIDIINKELDNHIGSKGILFDGFPRTVKQAEMLDAALEERGCPLKGLLEIKVGEEELTKRILERAKIEGRKDDNIDSLRKRLEEYRNKTVNVNNHYQGKNILLSVDGNKSIASVFEDIVLILDEIK